MIDPATKALLYVSKAHEAITGRSLAEVRENPNLYKQLLHPEDRGRFLDKLEEAFVTGGLDQEFRITRPDGAIRWIWSKGTLYQGPGDPPRLVGIAQDISERKQAEFEIAKHLAAAEAARSEAEALRNSTLALTRNLRMDAVLDTLLALLGEVVPYESASVILAEEDELYVARTSAKTVEMIEGRRNLFLERVRVSKKSVIFRDTADVSGWEDRGLLREIRSWICVPLLASTEPSATERLLGLLSVGHSQPHVFSANHFRIAESLAVPAAIAIQNARLFERAEIYAAELQATASRDGRQPTREPKNDA